MSEETLKKLQKNIEELQYEKNCYCVINNKEKKMSWYNVISTNIYLIFELLT